MNRLPKIEHKVFTYYDRTIGVSIKYRSWKFHDGCYRFKLHRRARRFGQAWVETDGTWSIELRESATGRRVGQPEVSFASLRNAYRRLVSLLYLKGGH